MMLSTFILTTASTLVVVWAMPEYCTLPREIGPCKALIPSYYYDTVTQKCEYFEYGGCQGNKNNFKTLKQCQKKCVPTCHLDPETGPCEALIQRYFYNKESQKCEAFPYGGCQGNGNNFKTLRKCQDTCICSQDPVQGMCMAYFPSFFYNSTSEACEKFIYGGCGGNGNRFWTEEDCLETCS